MTIPRIDPRPNLTVMKIPIMIGILLIIISHPLIDAEMLIFSETMTQKMFLYDIGRSSSRFRGSKILQGSNIEKVSALDAAYRLYKVTDKDGRTVIKRSPMIYFASNYQGLIARMNFNSSNFTVLRRLKSEEAGVSSLSVDQYSDLIYYANNAENTICVMSTDGLFHKVLIQLENSTKIQTLKVVPSQGLLFWSNLGPSPSIERASMDGSGRIIIVSTNILSPWGITIDEEKSKIYWGDRKTYKIEVANYDGSERHILVDSQTSGQPSMIQPYSMALKGRRLYWSDWMTGKIMSAKLPKVITDSQERPVKVYEALPETFDRPGSMAVLRTENLILSNDIHKYPCSRLNGGEKCEQLCLPAHDMESSITDAEVQSTWWKGATTTKKCACQDDLELIDNRCVNHGGSSSDPQVGWNPLEDEVMFVSDSSLGTILMMNLNQSAKTFRPLPIPLSSSMTAFDYDPQNKTIYWIDRYNAFQVRGKARSSALTYALDLMNNSTAVAQHAWNFFSIKAIRIDAKEPSEVRLIKKYNGLTNEPEFLAIDYVSRLLYVSDLQALTISVMDMSDYKEKVIVNNMQSPAIVLAVAPGEGLIFWIDVGKKGRIFSAWGDGSHKKLLFESKFDTPFELVVDHKDKMLYWTDTWHNSIQRMAFDGSSKTKILKGQTSGSLGFVTKNYMKNNYLFQPLGLAIDDHTMYWVDGVTNAIYALPKRAISKMIHNTVGEDDYSSQANPIWSFIYRVGPQIFKRPYRMKLDRSVTGLGQQMENACSQSDFKVCSHMCLPQPGNNKVCECPNGMVPKVRNSRTLCSYGENDFLPRSGAPNLETRTYTPYNKSLPILYFVDPLEPSLAVVNLNNPELYFDMLDTNQHESDQQSNDENIPWDPHNLYSSPSTTSTPSPISVDFDYIQETFYFVDGLDNSIKLIKMNSSVVLTVAKFFSHARITNIAVDPYTNLIYYTDIQNNIIGLISKDGRLQKDLLTLQDYTPSSLQLDSAEGYIYWSQWNEKGGKIIRSLMDGGYQKTLVETGLKKPISLTHDPYSNRLFWIDLILNNIGTCDMHGKGAGVIMVFENQYFRPLTIAISPNYIYWADRDRLNIFNISKDYLELHKISEYGVNPKYVTLAEDYMGRNENVEKIIVESKYSPEQTLKVGREIQIMLLPSFLSLTGLKFYNGTSTSNALDLNAAYMSCQKLGNRAHLLVSQVSPKHLSERLGGCSDFCYPFPDSEVSRICGCADQEGLLATISSHNEGRAASNNNSNDEKRNQYYIYYKTRLDKIKVLKEIGGVKNMEKSILLDDQLTCNRSLKCPAKGLNQDEVFKGSANLYGITTAICQAGTTVGDKCSFECLPGFISFSGQETRECLDSGRWSGELLTCQAIRCDKIDSPPNSRLVSCPGIFNTSCEFECDSYSNYDNGSLIRLCQETGTWSGSPLICKKKTCSYPPAIPHLNTFLVPNSCAPYPVPGSKCRIGCEGDKTQEFLIQCLDDGTWTQPDISQFQCQSNISTTAVDQQLKYRCHYPLLDSSSNAIVMSCPLNPKPGDMCHFRCQYPLVSYSGSSSVICLEDGSWSQPFLTCKALSCPIPTSPFNSIQIACNDANYGIDSRCSYKCSPGYHKFHGDETRQCLANGVWSGEELVCSKCSPLPQPSLGVLECYLDGQTIHCRVKCDEGAVLLGDGFLGIPDAKAESSFMFYCDEATRTWYPQNTNTPSCSVLIEPSTMMIDGTVTITKPMPERVSGQEGCSSILGYDSLDNDLNMPIELSQSLFTECSHLQELRCNPALALDKRECLTKDHKVLTFKDADHLNYDTYPTYYRHLYNFTLFLTKRSSNGVNSRYDIKKDHDDIEPKANAASVISTLLELNKDAVNLDKGSTISVREMSYHLTCDHGHVIVGQGCAGCPEGTKKAAEIELCIPCPVGHYQDMYAQEECKPCPIGYVAYDKGSYRCHDILSLAIKNMAKTRGGLFAKRYGIPLCVAFVILINVCAFYIIFVKKKSNISLPNIAQVPIPFKFLTRNFLKSKNPKEFSSSTSISQPFGNGIDGMSNGNGAKHGLGNSVMSTVMHMKNYHKNGKGKDPSEASKELDTDVQYQKFSHNS